MKKLILLSGLALCIYGSVKAQHTVDCSFTPVTGSITSNTTLYANTLYRLEGCVTVTTGVTLTIEPGTHILAEKASNAALYIAPGAYINAQGTPSLPIVFNTDQASPFRNYGDWEGIVIGGLAYNNVPTTGLITLTRNCSVSAGGTNDNDSSGIFRYVQIHNAKHALSLLSVGRKTIVDHIDASYSSKDAFELFGGTVKAKYLVSLNAKQNDFYLSYGYRGMMQFAIGTRQDAGAHDPALSYGLLIENNPSTASAMPYTDAVLSNFTILGPSFCNAGSLDGDFQDAVHIRNYVRGGIFNSVFTNWPVNGYYINGATSIANTAGSLLNFSYNSFSDNGLDYDHAGTWTTACESSMASWIETLGSSSCRELGNQMSGFGYAGYDNTLVCNTTNPDFRLDNATDLTSPNYAHASLSDDFFDDNFSYRGAFDETTSWIDEWTDFDGQVTDYCGLYRIAPEKKAAQSIAGSRPLTLAPNPAAGTTMVAFELEQIGDIRILVLDKVTGRTLRSIEITPGSKGMQHIPVDLSGLRAGSYVLRVETADGKVQHSQVMIAD